MADQALSLFSVYNEYLAINNSISNNRMLTSIFVRYLVPYFQGPSPKSDRATSDEVRAAQDYLKNLQPSHILEFSQILEKIFEEKNINKHNRKPFRSILKKFVDWAVAKGYCLQNQKQISNNVHQKRLEQHRSLRFSTPKGQAKKRLSSYHGRSYKDPYTLMGRYSVGKFRGQLIYPEDYVNEKLKSDIKGFEKFRFSNGCSQATVNLDLRNIYRVLGWLHRFKGVSLEKLSLCSIVRYQKLNVPLSECLVDGKPNFEKQFWQKAETRQLAVDFANETKELTLEYLDFIGGHPNTKSKVVGSIIAVAKFIFNREVGTDDYEDEEDLPVIRKLNKLHTTIAKQAKSAPPSVPYRNKSVSWEKAIEVLEKVRTRCNTYIIYKASGDKCKRQPGGFFGDLQHFLILGFLTLMPPDRARTYCDLEIGRTLVEGIYEKGLFLPKNKMQDPSQAVWYIHLEPADYKTGKIYGEWWGQVPNPRFSDGSKFYDYIDRWLAEGREHKQKCDHNYFFRGEQKYKKIDQSSLYALVQKIFIRYEATPVAPKEFRKMYVTFLKDNGATEAELEAAAYWMHHSRRMQSQVYDEQDRIKKMAPVTEFNNRMLGQLLGEKTGNRSS